MKKPYSCYTYYKYKKLIFKDFAYKLHRIIYANNKEDVLERYKTIEKLYDTVPFEARKIILKEYDIEECEENLDYLKRKMKYDEYLEMIKDRLDGIDVKLI